MVRAKANRSNSDYSSIDDLSLPRNQSTRSGLPESLPSGIRERSNSDSNLNLSTPQSWSTLTVDCRECKVGHGQSSHIVVSWDIKEDVGAQDWIGLYLAGKGKHHHVCVTMHPIVQGGTSQGFHLNYKCCMAEQLYLLHFSTTNCIFVGAVHFANPFSRHLSTCVVLFVFQLWHKVYSRVHVYIYIYIYVVPNSKNCWIRGISNFFTHFA